jgi:ubiquinone/menaquinone biosynthesis C-methylase UbiE
MTGQGAGRPLTLEAVSAVLAAHLPIYRWRKPVYQTAMLGSLQALWEPRYRRVLDVGGGTGAVAQAIGRLFPVDRVASVDVEDRFLPALDVETATFDGRRLPFDDASFDCVLFNNVIHHVRPKDRVPLLAECRRVAPAGGLLIKDHVAAGRLDHLRLMALDVIGNAPFHGMVRASYLSAAEWRALAEAAGYDRVAARSANYRGGAFAVLFPNRLETTMKWRPAAAKGP